MIHPSGLFFVSGVVESEMFEMILADPFCFGASFQELVQVSACEEPLRSSVPGPWPPFIKAAALCLFFHFELVYFCHIVRHFEGEVLSGNH